MQGRDRISCTRTLHHVDAESGNCTEKVHNGPRLIQYGANGPMLSPETRVETRF
jgi:hypothetical protein